MIIDLENIENLKHFLFDNANEDQLERCSKCCNNPELFKCENYEICKRYAPIMIDDKTKVLVSDLFDTIQYLKREKPYE